MSMQHDGENHAIWELIGAIAWILDAARDGGDMLGPNELTKALDYAAKLADAIGEAYPLECD